MLQCIVKTFQLETSFKITSDLCQNISIWGKSYTLNVYQNLNNYNKSVYSFIYSRVCLPKKYNSGFWTDDQQGGPQKPFPDPAV